MIEQDFNYADSTIKEMIDFFKTRVENLGALNEVKYETKYLLHVGIIVIK